MEVINTQPLLEIDTESENEDEIQSSSHIDQFVDDKRPIFRPSEPGDHYHMAYYIFYLLGITSLLPWNFFITADDYWMYKFRDPHSKLLSNFLPPKRTSLQASFISYVTIASNVPSIIFLILNAALIHKISLQARMIGSLLTILGLFIITTVCVKIDTDTWQQQFYYMTLAIVVLLNMAGAVFLGSLTAVMGKFAPPYISAIVSGQALGGVFAAIAQITALTIGASSEHSAFVYFTIGNVVIIISIVCYIFLTKTAFFKFHVSEKMGILHKTQSQVQPRIISYKSIYKRIWGYVLSAYVIFFVTLSAFPGVTVLVESEGKGHGFKWNDVYFVPVVSYLLYNLGDYLGRIIAGLFQWPRKPLLVLLMSILRIALVPLLVLCNAQPREYLPVIFNKDYYYIIFIILFSVTNGYFINISILWTPRAVEPHEKEVASSIMTVFIGAGLVSGSFTSVLLVKYL